MKKKLTAFAIALVCLFTFTSCMENKKQTPSQKPIAGAQSSLYELGNIERVKVTSDKAGVRSGCSGNSPVVQTCNKNNTLDVVSKVADWYAVKLPDNSIGFMPSSQCTPVIADNTNTPSQTGTAPGTASPGTSGTSGNPGTSTTPSPSASPLPGASDQGGSTSPKTPTAQTNSGSLTSLEQQMVNLVNNARSQNNVPALTVDMPLTNVARVKAQDMIDNNYFSHYSPKYGSPFDMMKSFGIKFVAAGENIAGNSNVQSAFNALMNSPGHRKNILNPDFTHVGIGIKKGGPYGYMISQMFISKPK